MGTGWKFEVIWKTMQEGDNQLSVSMLCEIAGVSRSGYYRWIKSAEARKEREKKDREDFELVLKAYGGTRHIYVYAPLGSASSNESKENKASDGQIRPEMPHKKSESIQKNGKSPKDQPYSREPSGAKIYRIRSKEGAADRHNLSSI